MSRAGFPYENHLTAVLTKFITSGRDASACSFHAAPRSIFACFLLIGLLAAVPTQARTGGGAEADVRHAAANDTTRLAPASAMEVRTALLYGGQGRAEAQDVAGRPRSVALAFGLSAVVPGLGQAYNRQWIKAAAGFAIEAALLTSYFVWRERGLEEEAAYIDYAHAYWSPARYARWLEDYTAFLPDVGRAELAVPDVDFMAPGAWTSEERQAVTAFFNQIRAAEREAYSLETGASFSHVLPYFGEQQYYELIGKYYQYGPGWEDYPAWLDENGDPLPSIIDPARREGSDRPNIRGRFNAYARDHAHANSLLRRASRASALLVVNHFLAAFDAALSAKLRNNRLQTDVRLGYAPDGTPQPAASLRLRF